METLRVLVVDDEPDYLETLVRRLERRGLDVQGAASGQDALAFIDRHEFDVVILDVKMPGMDGIQTLREMKNRGSRAEVILLTGHASVESGIQGMQCGAFDYVMKPVPLPELLDKVGQAGEKKRRQGSLDG